MFVSPCLAASKIDGVWMQNSYRLHFHQERERPRSEETSEAGLPEFPIRDTSLELPAPGPTGSARWAVLTIFQ